MLKTSKCTGITAHMSTFLGTVLLIPKLLDAIGGSS